MIDLHCHLLPGIDDGPPSLSGSLALARAARAAGTSSIVATPHVSLRYRNEYAGISAALAEARTAVELEGLELELLAGAEIAAPRVVDLEDEELSALTLGGGGWLLLECPLGSSATGFDAVALYLKDRGYEILLAHPERCPGFRREPEQLYRLLKAGMLTSLTAGSFVGQFGREVQRFATVLAEEGMLHNVASDAHDAVGRPPGIGDALAQAGLSELADWLTIEVPEAILRGGTIPRRPVTARSSSASASAGPRRRLWRGRRGS